MNGSRASVLFGHGSRDPAWRAAIDRVAQRMRDLDSQHLVRCAFLELTEPSLPQVAQELHAAGVSHIDVLPMFLGMGRHAREDLPAIVTTLSAQYPTVTFRLMDSVGEDPRVVDLLARMALDRT